VAKRGRGRKAGFAGVDVARVFGGQAGEIEQIDRSALSLQLLDISPGQVCSLRDDPLMSKMYRLRSSRSCSVRASAIAARAASQSVESS
jgi:hypothetical protein